MIELKTEEPQRNKVHTWRLYWFHESDPDASYPADEKTLRDAGYIPRQELSALEAKVKGLEAERENLLRVADSIRGKGYSLDYSRLWDAIDALRAPPAPVEAKPVNLAEQFECTCLSSPHAKHCPSYRAEAKPISEQDNDDSEPPLAVTAEQLQAVSDALINCYSRVERMRDWIKGEWSPPKVEAKAGETAPICDCIVTGPPHESSCPQYEDFSSRAQAAEDRTCCGVALHPSGFCCLPHGHSGAHGGGEKAEASLRRKRLDCKRCMGLGFDMRGDFCDHEPPQPSPAVEKPEDPLGWARYHINNQDLRAAILCIIDELEQSTPGGKGRG